MKRRLLTLGKTAVYVQPALILTLAYTAVTGYGDVMLTALFSIILHEAAHGAVAAAFGKPPAEVEITPMGALMRLEDEESLSPLARMLMILAGPAMTLLLCLAAFWGTKAGILSADLGRTIFLNNIALLVMNLLPALPLDGGRLLSMAASMFLQRETVWRMMRLLGYAIGGGCILLNLWMNLHLGGWNLSLTAAGCFLCYSAQQATTTQAMAELRMLIDRKIRLDQRGVLPCRWMVVTEKTPLRRLIQRLHPGKQNMYAVVQTGSQQHLGYLSEKTLISAYLQEPTGTVKDCLGVNQDLPDHA